MLILLYHVLPWQKYDVRAPLATPIHGKALTKGFTLPQFEFPPSKYSFSAWKRALHYLLFFIPENKFSFTFPRTLAPFSSEGRIALWAWAFW